MKCQCNSDHGAVVNCMCGTVQLPVIDFAKKLWKVCWVDVITAIAPEKTLSETQDLAAVNHICENIEASSDKQQIKHLAITAHSECDLNNVSDSQKKEMLCQAARFLQNKYKTVEVTAIWIDRNRAISMIEYC